MTRLRSNNRDLTSILIGLLTFVAFYLIGCHLARAAVAANPGPAMETGGDAALDMLAKDGPWWAAVGALNVGLRLFLHHQHWLKQGRLLTALTSLSAVLVAVAAWHWDGGPAAGILTALIAGGTLLLHPAPPAPPSKSGPALVTSILVATALVACSAAQARQTAAVGVVAALDCEAAHLDAQVFADAKAFAEAKVMQWIGGVAAPDSARIRADLAPIKSDLGRCAIAAALAAATVLLKPADPGAAISALSSSTVAPAAVRVQFEIGARLAGWPPVQLPGGETL